jgi:dimethylhistidine N-methyltransferase
MAQSNIATRARPVRDRFYYDVLEGLSQSQKNISPKYFYDRKGSEYFDQICHLDEYYPYRTELSLLPQVATALAGLLPPHCALVEFGAGSLCKVRPLLKAVPGIEKFVPIDISGEHLHAACDSLAREFRELAIEPVVADFSQPVCLSAHDCEHRVGFFPGSTIGNFEPPHAREFLVNARAALGEGSFLLIGVDTKKSPETLHRAYNDNAGITARFNLNLLERIGTHFAASVAIGNFEHYAFYNAPRGRIEMHLICNRAHTLVLDDVAFEFAQGESIHTENSYKYAPAEFAALAQGAGWHVAQHWMAQRDMFAIYLLQSAMPC